MPPTGAYILTLIAPRQGDLTEQIIKDCVKILDIHAPDLDWLRPDTACDIFLHGHHDATDSLRLRCRHHGIDMFLQKSENRRKKLLLADMDSTIVTSETLDDLAEFAGLKDQISAITRRAMNGELDFESALNERVAMLNGLSETVLEDAYKQVKITPGAEILVKTMAANGAYTALVSGGFKFFTSRIRQRLQFDMDFSNDFVIENGQLTGSVQYPILGQAAKLETLHRLAEDQHIELSQTLTVGDGANDLSMINEAGLGVAFHGKPVVAEQARHRIEYGDLSTLLYAQGYRYRDFKQP